MADFVVPTGLGRAFSLKRVREIAKIARSMNPKQRERRRLKRRVR